MANVVPEPEDIIAEVLLHIGFELEAIDVLIHGAMKNEVGKGLASLHQGGLTLGVGDRPNANVRVLAGDGTHPGVLGSLVKLIPEGNARFGKLLIGGSKLGEGGIEQPGNEVQDPLRGDFGVHVTMGEGTHKNNTPDQIGAVV